MLHAVGSSRQIHSMGFFSTSLQHCDPAYRSDKSAPDLMQVMLSSASRYCVKKASRHSSSSSCSSRSWPTCTKPRLIAPGSFCRQQHIISDRTAVPQKCSLCCIRCSSGASCSSRSSPACTKPRLTAPGSICRIRQCRDHITFLLTLKYFRVVAHMHIAQAHRPGSFCR